MQADKITGGTGFKGKGVPPVVYSWKPRQRADGNKKDHLSILECCATGGCFLTKEWMLRD